MAITGGREEARRLASGMAPKSGVAPAERQVTAAGYPPDTSRATPVTHERVRASPTDPPPRSRPRVDPPPRPPRRVPAHPPPVRDPLPPHARAARRGLAARRPRGRVLPRLVSQVREDLAACAPLPCARDPLRLPGGRLPRRRLPGRERARRPARARHPRRRSALEDVARPRPPQAALPRQARGAAGARSARRARLDVLRAQPAGARLLRDPLPVPPRAARLARYHPRLLQHLGAFARHPERSPRGPLRGPPPRHRAGARAAARLHRGLRRLGGDRARGRALRLVREHARDGERGIARVRPPAPARPERPRVLQDAAREGRRLRGLPEPRRDRRRRAKDPLGARPELRLRRPEGRGALAGAARRGRDARRRLIPGSPPGHAARGRARGAQGSNPRTRTAIGTQSRWKSTGTRRLSERSRAMPQATPKTSAPQMGAFQGLAAAGAATTEVAASTIPHGA